MASSTDTAAPHAQQPRRTPPPQDRLYQAVDLASRRLRGDPRDVGVRNTLVAGYAKLGVFELAAETAEGFEPEVRDHPEVQTAIASLRRMAPARVSWSMLDARYQRNLAALLKRQPQFINVEDAWRHDQGRSVELYRCTDGNLQVCRRDEQGLPVWWPKIGDHRAEADRTALPNTPNAMCPPFLFEGIDTHCLFDRVCRETYRRMVTYIPALYVVEPNPLWAAVALHLYDWQDVLTQDRVLLFVGAEAVDGFRDYLLEHDQARTPAHRVRHDHPEGDLQASLGQAIDQVIAARNDKAERFAAETKRLYAQRGPRFLHDRINGRDPERPVRVMFLVSRFTTVLKYTIRDLSDGFAALGYPTEILTEQTDFGCLSLSCYHRRMLEFEPDVVIIPDHIRVEYGELFPPQLIVTTWMQDRMPHLLTRDAGQAVRTTCAEPDGSGLTAPTDYVFGYLRATLVDEFGYPPETFLAYPLIPSNPRTRRPVTVTPELKDRYGCEVAFLGHGGEPCEQAFDELITECPAPVQRVARAVFEIARDRYNSGGDLLYTGGRIWRSQLQETAEQVAAEMGIDPAVLAGFDGPFNLLSDRLWRHATLQWLVDLDVDLRLYGRGWDQHPVFARFARPPVNDPEEICAIYGCAKVNLQVGAYSAMHQRLVNGCFAGGFFLVRDSSHNYQLYDHSHQAYQVGPATPDERQAALRSLVELSRRGCDSLEAFTALQNAELLDALVPVVREGVDAHERDDMAAIWRMVDHATLVVPPAVFPDCWDQITFRSRDELAGQLDRFCRREPERRTELAAYMRERCLASHGTERMARRLLQHIGRGLAHAVNGDPEARRCSS